MKLKTPDFISFAEKKKKKKKQDPSHIKALTCKHFNKTSLKGNESKASY